jgi:hypothetical protein
VTSHRRVPKRGDICRETLRGRSLRTVRILEAADQLDGYHLVEGVTDILGAPDPDPRPHRMYAGLLQLDQEGPA